MARFFILFFLLLIFLTSGPITQAQAAEFKLVNKCRHTIWPGLLSGATSPPLPTTGFSLPAGKSKTLTFPKSWSGRIWARTLCSGNPAAGKLICLTGDCASGKLECAGAGAIPPATLAEFTLNGAGGLDFYDVSLVDGYNLPILVVPRGGHGGGDCSPTGCLVDINGACPKELSVVVARGNGSQVVGAGSAVACNSACRAFGDPRFCCSEGYNTPDTCPPSVYSVFFKEVCPRAYSYAYDDKTSTFTCASADYIIVFCPPPYTRRWHYYCNVLTEGKSSSIFRSDACGQHTKFLHVDKSSSLQRSGCDLVSHDWFCLSRVKNCWANEEWQVSYHW